METRKVVIRVKKTEPIAEKPKSEKQIRYEARIAERKANKQPNKVELLALEGKRHVNFVTEIELFNEWLLICDKNRMSPNDRFNALIKSDKEENK